MTPKEKIASLKVYVENHKNRLTAPVPKKREKNPEAYRDYLRLEIKKAERTIEKLLAEGK